ncbi:MAG: SUMF1/EgtB/PvdO family nonheme iron enzyme [Candidatus Latescibacterota bacterium]
MRIPAGEFPMGSEEGEPDERPVHQVALEAYWLDRFEVTVAEYRACVEAGACMPPEQGGACTWGRPGRDAHPVNCVDWTQAACYCSWVGERLPTEAEWERAARGPQGRRFAWGDGPPQGRRGGNVADESARQAMPTWTVISGYDDGYPATAPMGRFEPTPEGLYDLSGNLTEWVADWYEAEYYARSPRGNPLGPGTGRFRVVRSGSWRNADDYLRASYRYGLVPGYRAVNVGFRCAR